MKQIYLLRFLAAKLQLFLQIHNTFPSFSSKYLVIIDLNQISCYNMNSLGCVMLHKARHYVVFFLLKKYEKVWIYCLL